MYNLVKFILKYHFTFLFIILEIFAGIIIFQNNKYQQVKFLNASNFLTGGVYSFQENVKSYFKLKEVNRKLAEENAELRNQVNEIFYSEIPTLYNDTVFKNDTIIVDTTRHLKHIAAKVISNSVNKQFNIIYINKGKSSNIDVDMGVINADGVVGVVRSVSSQYATITPIINQDLNINAKIKNSGYFGNLTWNGKDPMFSQLYDIPNHISPKLGDTVVTSGYSNVFDEGQIIGFIDEVYAVPGKSFININVKLAVDFGNIKYVYGIINPRKEELDSLALEF